MKKIFAPILTILIFIGCKTQHPNLDSGLYADIKTNKGSMVIKLAYEKAPITVANFVSLSEGSNTYVSEEFKSKKFYNGLKFHRVIAEFMIQGGDPTGTGSGSPGYRFDDEFSDLTHKGPGILSMANSGPATNGSQFFITHKATPWLDGKHTVFGELINGQEVLDSVAQNDIIEEIIILRKGIDAKKFDAPEIFNSYFSKKDEIAKEKEAKQEAIKQENFSRFDKQRKKTTTNKSGLKYIITSKGKGVAVSSSKKAMVHYAVYFEDGTILETSEEKVAITNNILNLQRQNAGQYQPIEASVGVDAKMIEGFKEGLRLLNEGDKATLFLPYSIAYGAEGVQGIPPKSNLIFEVEIVKVIQ